MLAAVSRSLDGFLPLSSPHHAAHWWNNPTLYISNHDCSPSTSALSESLVQYVRCSSTRLLNHTWLAGVIIYISRNGLVVTVRHVNCMRTCADHRDAEELQASAYVRIIEVVIQRIH